MFRTISSNGIVSYAGLDLKKVCLQMKLLLDNKQSLLHGFIPLFPAELIQNMPYKVYHDTCIAPNGFSVNPVLYHNKLYREYPDLYQGENARRCLKNQKIVNGGVVVDEAWCKRFPQYAPFMGEQLYIRQIGGGHQAVAVPQSLYPLNGEFLIRVEEMTGISENAHRVAEYMRARASVNLQYDDPGSEFAYLAEHNLTAPWLSQKELEELITETELLPDQKKQTQKTVAKKIDLFTPAKNESMNFTGVMLSPHSGLFAQLYDTGDEFVSNYWIPWKIPSPAVNNGIISAKELCSDCFLPLKALADGGAKYPSALRVVRLRRKLHAQKAVGENNTDVFYIPNSQMLLRKGAMHPENLSLQMTDLFVSEEEWLCFRNDQLIRWQLGQLEEALYRRNRLLEDWNQLPLEEAAFRYMMEERNIAQLEASLKETDLTNDRIRYLKQKFAILSKQEKGDLPDGAQKLEETIREKVQLRALPVYDWREVCSEKAEKNVPRRGRRRKRTLKAKSDQMRFV